MTNSTEPPSKERSALMRMVRVKRTSLELQVDALVKERGYKLRRNFHSLPGSPDLVVATQKKAIFVHGCFWHGHSKCAKGRTRPKTRTEFWENKIASNQRRDRRVIRELRRLGWKALTIWECQLRDIDTLTSLLNRFLGYLPEREVKRGN